MIHMQPIGCYVEEAKALLPEGAPWHVVRNRAWQLQVIGEAEEEQNFRSKFLSHNETEGGTQ